MTWWTKVMLSSNVYVKPAYPCGMTPKARPIARPVERGLEVPTVRVRRFTHMTINAQRAVVMLWSRQLPVAAVWGEAVVDGLGEWTSKRSVDVCGHV